MDEVENPELPSAGEASPTLRPIEDEEDAEKGSNGIAAVDVVTAEDGTVGIVENNADEGRRKVLARPVLRREGSAPPPPPLPIDTSDTSAIAADGEGGLQDSLTLADLRRLRSAFPTTSGNSQTLEKDHRPLLLENEKVYDFEYRDAQSLPVEVEEWFSYAPEELQKLRRCRQAFEAAWTGPAGWVDVSEDVRRSFVTKQLESIIQRYEENGEVQNALLMLTYIALGVPHETSGQEATGCTLSDLFPDCSVDPAGSRLQEYSNSSLQIQWIVAMVDTLHSCHALYLIDSVMRDAVESSLSLNPSNDQDDVELRLWCSTTLICLFLEVARTAPGESGRKLKDSISGPALNLPNYFMQIIARLRWLDEGVAPIPLTKVLLLAWKSILVTIGGLKDVELVKTSLRQDADKDEEGSEKDSKAKGPLITASPLDYHLFRQEISSKYPAYTPPPPLFPLEPENNSILPPLKHRRPSYAATVDTPTIATTSTMHQPVHIATPAPSPPPSPAAGPGKAGKKQNYQTNQMFPFLYPPLDATSNDLGGRGTTELQDVLVGRKWEGSDVPASILEAAELFAERMRATRAMKQLWEARVEYMKYERGWKAPSKDNEDDDGFEVVEDVAPEESAPQGQPLPQTETQKSLAAVDRFYRDSLPHLQSVVIVILKAVLQNVTDLVTKGSNGQNGGLQAGIQFNELNGVNGSAKPMENGTNHTDGVENSAEELDHLRTQEIASKALSAILLLLLKWFKVSHILQYEYLTQLLLDSNYVPLVLKLWQTQDVGRAVHYRLEREEANFFTWCQNSTQTIDSADPEDSDSAVPPPIKLKRDSPQDDTLSNTAADMSHPPEVDELGYPTTPLPSSPIKHYSYRNVFTQINYLRILQKATRRKTHRALLLVSYKSSQHLRKLLRVPIHPMRYYVLKLVKSQVPFCGRKWRQANMKIITAVWLSVPAELRDDWLMGGGGGVGGAGVGDVDGTVEDAVPMEQALRALTHWWNLRSFPDVMGLEKGLDEEEMDYFTRELEKMEMGREVLEEAVEDVGGDGMPWQGPIEGY